MTTEEAPKDPTATAAAAAATAAAAVMAATPAVLICRVVATVRLDVAAAILARPRLTTLLFPSRRCRRRRHPRRLDHAARRRRRPQYQALVVPPRRLREKRILLLRGEARTGAAPAPPRAASQARPLHVPPPALRRLTAPAPCGAHRRARAVCVVARRQQLLIGPQYDVRRRSGPGQMLLAKS